MRTLFVSLREVMGTRKNQVQIKVKKNGVECSVLPVGLLTTNEFLTIEKRHTIRLLQATLLLN